jgi:hypothetical protein
VQSKRNSNFKGKRRKAFATDCMKFNALRGRSKVRSSSQLQKEEQLFAKKKGSYPTVTTRELSNAIAQIRPSPLHDLTTEFQPMNAKATPLDKEI